jgi:hypothetical protein
MGSKVRGKPEAAPVTAEGGDSEASAGRYLARQRQLREISLDELAARTKIPRRSLERLESGAFDGQADGFVRGFVRTVAEALGLDPNEAVMRLLREPPAAREPAPPLARVRLGWAIGGLLALAAVAAALLAGGRALRGRFAPEPPAVIYRTDAVRSLVEERARGGGAAAPGSAAPAPAQGGAALPRPEEGPGGL